MINKVGRFCLAKGVKLVWLFQLYLKRLNGRKIRLGVFLFDCKFTAIPPPRNPHILVFWIEIIIHKWYPKTVLSEECAGKRYAKYYSKCPICIFSILPKGRIG